MDAAEPATPAQVRCHFADLGRQIHERNGRVIARSIRLGDQVISAKASLADKIRRMFADTPSVRRP